MFIYRLKNFIAVALAVLFSLVFCVGIRYVNVTKLSALKGERTYYLDSASSQSLQKTSLDIGEFFRVRGESIVLDLHAYTGGRGLTNEEIVKMLAEEYGAQTYIVEEGGGVVSYYGYTPRWKESVWVQGKAINLHIAFRDGACAVGTPIIFGGF